MSSVGWNGADGIGQTGSDDSHSAGSGEHPRTPVASRGGRGDGSAPDPTSLLEGETGERERFVDELHRVLSRKRAIERDRGGG